MGEIDDIIRRNAKAQGFTDEQITKALKELKDEGMIKKSDYVGYEDNLQITPTGANAVEAEFVKKFGQYKKILDVESGKWHRVSTIVIIREGIRQEDLKHFPEWLD